jgi:hypothetical protein
MLGDAVSPVGRTRTAPAPGSMPDLLKLAVASCQHWEFGSYAAHRHIARGRARPGRLPRRLHLRMGRLPAAHPQRAVRRTSRSRWPTTASATRSTRAIRTCRRAPGGALDRDLGRPRSGQRLRGDRDERLSPLRARRAAAYQAFYEHMPLRLPPPRSFASVRMYQRYDWGRLARFHVLDDRQYRARAGLPGKPGRGGSNVGGPARLPCPARSGAHDAGHGAGSLAGRRAWHRRSALEHPGPADADGAVDPGADRHAGRRPLLDRWLGWLSGGAPAPARHAGEEPRGQSAGAGRRRAHLLCERAAARFQPAGVEGQSGDRDRVRAAPRSPRARARSSAPRSTWR